MKMRSRVETKSGPIQQGLNRQDLPSEFAKLSKMVSTSILRIQSAVERIRAVPPNSRRLQLAAEEWENARDDFENETIRPRPSFVRDKLNAENSIRDLRVLRYSWSSPRTPQVPSHLELQLEENSAGDGPIVRCTKATDLVRLLESRSWKVQWPKFDEAIVALERIVSTLAQERTTLWVTTSDIKLIIMNTIKSSQPEWLGAIETAAHKPKLVALQLGRLQIPSALTPLHLQRVIRDFGGEFDCHSAFDDAIEKLVADGSLELFPYDDLGVIPAGKFLRIPLPPSLTERLTLDKEQEVVAFDGKRFSLTSTQFGVFWRLFEAGSNWISSKELLSVRPKKIRVDHIMKRFPPELGALIVSKRGTGYRLKRT